MTPPPLGRVTVLLPGQELPHVIDAPSLLVLAAPDINAPAHTLTYVHAPSELHLVALAAAALGLLRKSYGDLAVMAALEAEQQIAYDDVTSDALIFPQNRSRIPND